MDLFRTNGDANSSIRFKVFNKGASVPLSDVLPMPENMGLRVIDEIPHEIRDDQGECVWIHDFGMVTRDGAEIDVDGI